MAAAAASARKAAQRRAGIGRNQNPKIKLSLCDGRRSVAAGVKVRKSERSWIGKLNQTCDSTRISGNASIRRLEP